MGAAFGAIRFQLFVGEVDARETGTTGSIHKDILLCRYHQDHTTSCGIGRR